jgi:hypothetical protein
VTERRSPVARKGGASDLRSLTSSGRLGLAAPDDDEQNTGRNRKRRGPRRGGTFSRTASPGHRSLCCRRYCAQFYDAKRTGLTGCVLAASMASLRARCGVRTAERHVRGRLKMGVENGGLASACAATNLPVGRLSVPIKAVIGLEIASLCAVSILIRVFCCCLHC